MQPADIARLIDHTLLRPDATDTMLRRLCGEAVRHGFWSVCVNPVGVALAAEVLRGSEVRVCSVVGFPFGASTPQAKAVEAERAVADGASEIDMVIDLGALKDGRHNTVLGDVTTVRGTCPGAVLKVIIETCLLEDAEKEAACRIAAEAGADFVKTSTGYAGRGATLADVALMRRVVGSALGVKASGGVRDYATARAMIEAGASRIGTSSGVAIVTAAKAEAGSY